MGKTHSGPSSAKKQCYLFVNGSEVLNPYTKKPAFSSPQAARTQALTMGPGLKFKIYVEGQSHPLTGVTWGGIQARDVSYLGTRKHPVPQRIHVQASGTPREDTAPGRGYPAFDAATAAKLSNKRVKIAPGALTEVKETVVRRGPKGSRKVVRVVPGEYKTLVVDGEVVGGKPRAARPIPYGISARDFDLKMEVEKQKIAVHDRVQEQIDRYGGVPLDALIALQLQSITTNKKK